MPYKLVESVGFSGTFRSMRLRVLQDESLYPLSKPATSPLLLGKSLGGDDRVSSKNILYLLLSSFVISVHTVKSYIDYAL